MPGGGRKGIVVGKETEGNINRGIAQYDRVVFILPLESGVSSDLSTACRSCLFIRGAGGK